MDRRFPEGFLWGAATAAYQIEGAVNEGGRGQSIWDTFSHTAGRTLNGDTGDVACQHYRHTAQDLRLMKDLGLGAYRFSVAWPRVQPDGKGAANEAGLDFYRRLVADLRQQGIVPVATLYHWDLPQALEDVGGWTARDTAERFADYAAMVVEALSDGVGMWITLNEPWCSAWLGYGVGVHAPGRRDLGASVSAAHHLLLAHARGTEVLRAGTRAPVGITLNLGGQLPGSDHELDIAAARRADGAFNRMYLGPLFKGAYPEDVIEVFSSYKPGFDVVEAGDLAAISQPVDFLGVNYYNTSVVVDPGRLAEARTAGYCVGPQGDDGAAPLRAVAVGRPELVRTASDWEVDPEGLTRLLVRLRDEYTPAPIYVTENGSAQLDYVEPDGAVHDPARIRFLHDHIQAAKDAIDQGVDLRGYFVWSLLDNFEWAMGYSMRFGLVWVDYPTAARVPKDSYSWYRRVVASNSLPAPG
ncbi:MAG TPA: family 1 glycosylhydrolase [Acidimicrobiales bacterium]|nr:family 1 glycosylhydrolase [Acidimicrobiales bacterium]